MPVAVAAGQAAREREPPAVGRAARAPRRVLPAPPPRAEAGAASAAGSAAWPPDSTKPRMSFFVTRPPRPVPGTWETSTPCSDAIRATTGETKLLPSPFAPGSAGAGAGAGVGGSAGAASGSCGVGVSALAAASLSAAASAVAGSGGAASAAGAAPSLDSAGAAPAAPMTARRVPTSTVSPSWTRICCTTPVPGLGTSVSTLSVEISSNGSSAWISSPSCLSHFVIVPSETETPIWGITTSTAVGVAMLVLLPVMRPRLQGPMTKPGKDAGSLHAEQHGGD